MDHLRGGAALKFSIGSKTYELPVRALPLKMPGANFHSGEMLWSGIVTDGDRVLVDKLSYRFSAPQRGDLLAFKTDGISIFPKSVFKTDGIPNSPKSDVFIKRIAGLPGERVRIEPPYLIINDAKVTQPAIYQDIAGKTNGHAGFLLAERTGYSNARLVNPTDEMVLGNDEYFVLGDNTANSLDSRHWGPVPKKNIVGKVARIYWPFTRINALE